MLANAVHVTIVPKKGIGVFKILLSLLTLKYFTLVRLLNRDSWC